LQRQVIGLYLERPHLQLVWKRIRRFSEMVELEAADNAPVKMPKRTRRLSYQRQRHEPRMFDLRSELYLISELI